MLFRKSLDYFLFLILLFVPFITLVQFDGAIYPYVTSKHFVFRFCVLLAGGIWLGLIGVERRLRPRVSSILVSSSFFLVVAFVADLQGANFWNSFWSNYSRMEGFISLLYFFIFFLLLSSILNSEKRWRVYWLFHVIVSIVIMVIAVLQKMGLMLAVDYNRVDSVFGNASYLAIYASMIFFLCIYLFFSHPSKWLKAFVISAAFCNLISIYLSQTRSATLAVLLCLALFFYLAVKNKKTAFLVIAGGLLFFAGGVFILKSRTGLATNLFERIAQVSMKDSSTNARIEIWAYCWRAFLDQPVFGWGQESFNYLAPYFKSQLWLTPFVDRSHNIFIEWMVNAGIFGLIGISLVLWFIFSGLIRAKTQELPQLQKLALIGFFVCWLVNECLSIDFFSITVLFYSLMAFVHTLQLQNKNSEPASEKSVSLFKKIAFAIIFILVGLVLNYELNVSGLLKNIEMRTFSKNQSLIEGETKANYKAQWETLNQNNRYFENRELRTYLIQNAFFVLNQYRLKAFSEAYTKFYYKTADEFIQKEIASDPQDLFFKHLAANFYTQFLNFPVADKLFQELIVKVPEQQLFWIDYGHLMLAQGRMPEGLKLYQKAYDLEPGFYGAKMYLAMGMIYNKRFEEGLKLTDELLAEQRLEAFDERLINAYLANNMKKKAEQLMEFKEKYSEMEAR